MLQGKLDAVAIYEQYIEDAREAGNALCEQLFEEIRQQDEQQAQRLTEALELMVRNGTFH